MEPANTLDVIHALLDMVVSVDDTATEEENDRASQTAFERLNEIGALTAVVDDETDEIHMEVTPLLTAVAVLIDTPIRLLALHHDSDRLTVLATVREHLDAVFREDV
jgi:hypothetical protein